MRTPRPCALFFNIVLIAVVATVVVGRIVWLSALISGGTEIALTPRLLVPPLPVPGTAGSESSRNALGADFSQVYFSAQAIRHGDSAYEPANPFYSDRLGRRSNYPPLVNWLYLPLVTLSYPAALLVHTFGTILLFAGVTVWVMWSLGLARHLGKILTLSGLLYFYTANGFFHVERGQFDLIVASSMALSFALVFAKRQRLALAGAAGLTAAVKYSSLPFLGSFCLLGYLGSGRRPRWAYLLPFAIVLLSAVLFYRQMVDYYPSLKLYEFGAEPFNVTVSFSTIMPRTLAKLFQILCMAAFCGLFWFRIPCGSRERVFAMVSLPYALAMGAQGMCFGTQSFEYRSVMFIGLIPALYLWLEKSPASEDDKRRVAVWFACFLVIALRSFEGLLPISQRGMAYTYLAFSLVFLWISARMVLQFQDNCQPEPAPP
jgi:hypothetical protein